jgi:predicted transcriptional regulator YdeE
MLLPQACTEVTDDPDASFRAGPRDAARGPAPASRLRRVGAHDLEYLVGVEVASVDALPAELGRMRVPAVRYAVFTHAGPVETIRTTWNAALNEWLPSSGFRSAQTPDFERYDERFDAATGSGIVEIWVGVVPA